MKKTFLLITTCLLLGSGISAQVTIGSGQTPNKGALLDLKEKADGTSVRGLSLPRVQLTNNSDITNGDITGVDATNKNAHIGLLVYNTGSVTTSATARLCPGLHVWDGDKWSPIVPYPTIVPTKTMVGKKVTAESSRADISGTAGYLIGPLGQFPDTRGPSGAEVNQYHHARFYTHLVQATGDVTYRGIKNPYVCDASLAIEEVWTENNIPFEYVDDGVWMTENLNTRYQTATATAAIPIVVTSGLVTGSYNPQYATPENSSAPSPAQIRQNGLLYNWAAATNKKGGTTGQGNEDGNISEPNAVHKVRQGICLTGWHLPSDKEWNELEAAYAPASSNFTINATTGFTWETSFNTSTAWRPNNANSFGHGKSMKSTTQLHSSAITNGDSKTAADGGFNLLLTGYMYPNTGMAYYEYMQSSYLWTSSSNDPASAWARRVYNGGAGVYRLAIHHRQTWMSVRCKKD